MKWVDEWRWVGGSAELCGRDEGTRPEGGEGRYSIVDSSTRRADLEEIFLTHGQGEEAHGGSTRNEEASV